MKAGPTDAQLERVAAFLRRRAARGIFWGQMSGVQKLYIESCTGVAYGTKLIFTRDAGHHSSGWMKNPDYERCWHLSTSAAPTKLWTPSTPDLDRELKRRWLDAFFGEDLRYVWHESPKTEVGIKHGVEHWRVFCDEHWVPIVPRGEVYSTELTELGWKSWSELGNTIVSSVDPS